MLAKCRNVDYHIDFYKGGLMLEYPKMSQELQNAQAEIVGKVMLSQYETVKNIITKTKLTPLKEEEILDIIGELSKMDGEFTFESFWLKYARLIEEKHGIKQIGE